MRRSETDGTPDEPTEVMHGDADEWPVSELYRVGPEDEDVGEEATIVATSAPVDEPTPPGRRLPVHSAPIAAAIALATLAIGLGAWLLTQDSADAGGQAVAAAPAEPAQEAPEAAPAQGTTPTRSVPDVVGMPVAEARALLTEAGFEVRVQRTPSDGRPGEVLRQAPPAGSDVEPGGTVTLTVARPAQPVVVQVEVPDVVSLPVAQASSIIRRAQLGVQVELVPAQGAASGTVVEQRPAAGAEVEEGARVVLAVAGRGQEAAVRVTVPDVVGSTVADARRTLRELKLRSSVARVFSDEPAGTVVGQSPRAGVRLQEGASIRLRVSAGPRSVTVPDVLGLDEVTARDQLEAEGFVVRVSEEPTEDPANDGVVLRQSPAGGASGQDGQVVTIVLGRYD